MWNTGCRKYKSLLGTEHVFRSKSNKDNLFSPTSHLVQLHLLLFPSTSFHCTSQTACHETIVLLNVSQQQCTVVLCSGSVHSAYQFKSHLLMHNNLLEEDAWIRFKHFALSTFFLCLLALTVFVKHYSGVEIATSKEPAPNYCFYCDDVR